MTVAQINGIVPPWFGDDWHTWDDSGNYLPVLPLPPSPPDWDLALSKLVKHYDEGDPGTFDPSIPDRDERGWGDR